jgi:hypothetical protein
MLDLVVASHAPFAFPTHARTRSLLRQLADEKAARIFFAEPPVRGDWRKPRLEIGSPAPGIYTLTPLLPASMQQPSEVDRAIGSVLDAFFDRRQMSVLVLWHTSVDGLAFTPHPRVSLDSLGSNVATLIARSAERQAA